MNNIAKYILKFGIPGIFLIALSMVFTMPVHAAYIPDIDGYVLVSGTNAPIPNIWVRMTSSGCGGDPATRQSRYTRTDSNGHYVFIGWTQGGGKSEQGVSIDTDQDGSNDAIWYPTKDLCDPTGTPGSIFSCGRDPFEITAIVPARWRGSFDVIGKVSPNGKACQPGDAYCINNSQAAAQVPTVYYHGARGGATRTPTPTFGAGTSTPTPAASACTITLPSSITVPIGSTSQLVSPGIKISGSSKVDQLQFSLSSASDVSVCSSSLASCPAGNSSYTDITPAFNAHLTGFSPGSTTLSVRGTLKDGTICTDPSGVSQVTTSTVTVSNPLGWWQTKNSDVLTNGNILSQIPTSCTAPSCVNSLIIADPNQNSGVAIAGGSIDVSPGKVSSPSNWNSKSLYTGNPYSYDFFENKAKCGVMQTLPTSTISSLSDLQIGSPSGGGYYWIRYNGAAPLTIANDLDVGSNKIILFVKGSDLNINGNISITPGRGFFFTITEKNIQVGPSVTSLSGIYFTNGQFRTGTTSASNDQKLIVKGSVAAFDRIVLERAIANNSTSPAESFEYSADQILQFPACLGESNIQWRELAP